MDWVEDQSYLASLRADVRQQTLGAVDNMRWVFTAAALSLPVCNAALVTQYTDWPRLIVYVVLVEIVGILTLYSWFSERAKRNLSPSGVPKYAVRASAVWIVSIGLLQIVAFSPDHPSGFFMAGNAMGWGVMAGLNILLQGIVDYRREYFLLGLVPNQIATLMAGEWVMFVVVVAGMVMILAGILSSQAPLSNLMSYKAKMAERADNEAHRSRHDNLTGLLNRHGLFDSYTPFHRSALYIDLDHFKAINDNFGHAAGDRVLIEVSQRIQAACRESDLIARLGGDEFVVICSVSKRDHLDLLAARIQDAISTPVSYEGTELGVEASVGICVSKMGSSLDSLLDRSDQEMLRHKRTRHETMT